MNEATAKGVGSKFTVLHKLLLVWAVLASLAAFGFAALSLILFFRGNTPPLPVTVSFRNALLDNSLVARFHNNSASTLKVIVDIRSRDTGGAKQAELVLGGGSTTEVGWSEGWRFVSGESLHVHNMSFRDLDVVVP